MMDDLVILLPSVFNDKRLFVDVIKNIPQVSYLDPLEIAHPNATHSIDAYCRYPFIYA